MYNKYVFIRYLESIKQALCAYFGLDKRECERLEYLFIYFYSILSIPPSIIEHVLQPNESAAQVSINASTTEFRFEVIQPKITRR
jgi:hypothetical protein